MLITILQIIVAIATIITGLVSLIRPRSVTGFTGLEPRGGRGITEIRAILGGLFVALGASPLLLGTAETYMMLGIVYLGVGLVRAVSMWLDNSVVRSNSISLAVEIIFGIILLL